MRSLLRKTKAGSNGLVYPFRQERKVLHEKSIINGKLYDTEKAEFLCPFKDGRILLKTKKGNYFSCVQDIRSANEEKMDEIIETVTISHYDLREETEETAKEYVGIREQDLYVKLFGEVEEAQPSKINFKPFYPHTI